MGIPSQQIGWSQKAKLLWNISKQLERLTQVAGNIQIAPGTTTTTTSTTVVPAGDLLTTLGGKVLVTLSGDQIITL